MKKKLYILVPQRYYSFFKKKHFFLYFEQRTQYFHFALKPKNQPNPALTDILHTASKDSQIFTRCTRWEE